MKKLLLIGLTALMLTSCLEQGANEDGGSSTAPVGIVPSQPSNPPPYTRTLLPITSADLTDISLWYYTKNSSAVTLLSTTTSATYSSSDAAGVASVNTKFKMLGDSNDNGAISISSMIRISSGIDSRFYFDFSNNYSSCLLIKMTYHDGFLRASVGTFNGVSESFTMEVVYSPTGTGSLPFTFTRSNTGLVTVNLDGNILSFSGAAYSGDVDVSSLLSGAGTVTLDNWSVSPSTYAEFGGH